MTARPCPCCGQPCGDDNATICRRCWTRTVDVLATLEHLIADLEITVTRQSSLPGTSAGGGSRVDFDPVAADLRDTIRASLVGWCRVVHEDLGDPIPHDTIVDMCNTIATSRMRHHEAADEACREITSWPHLIATAVDWPQERHVSRVDRCVRSGEGWSCDGWLHVHHPTAGAPYVSCHSCEAQWMGVEAIEELGVAVRTRANAYRLLAAIRPA